MSHPMGAVSESDFRVDFDPRVRLEFHGSKISSDGGLLLYRELDEALSLFDKTVRFLRDTRKGKNGVHTLLGLLRQSVFGRLAGYEAVNDAAPLRVKPRPPPRWVALRRKCSRLPPTGTHWLICTVNGWTRYMSAKGRTTSLWTWIARSAQLMETRKAALGTGISGATAIIRCSSSISLAIWNAVPCAMVTSTARMTGKLF